MDWIKIIEGAMILIGLGVIIWVIYKREKPDDIREKIRKDKEKI